MKDDENNFGGSAQSFAQNISAGVRRVSETLVHLSLFICPSPEIKHPRLTKRLTQSDRFHMNRVYGDQDGMSWFEKKRHTLYMWAAGPHKTACLSHDVVAYLDPAGESSAVRLAEVINMPSLPGCYRYPEAETPADCWEVTKKYFWPHLAVLHMREGLAPQSWGAIVEPHLAVMDQNLERLNRELKRLNPELSHIELPSITRQGGDLSSYYTNIVFFAGAQYQFPAADIEAFVASRVRAADVRDETDQLEKRLRDVFGEKTKIGWVMSAKTRQDVEAHLSVFEAQTQTPR
jgi:hypothetical protein